MDNILTEDQVFANILKAFETLSGEEIARIHNEICSRQIKYNEDSVWEYVED